MNPEQTDSAQPTDDELDDIEIETIGSWETPIEDGVDPHRNSSLVTHPAGRPRGEPEVFIHADALHKALEHTLSDTRNEVGGVLLGEFYRSHGKLVTDVHDAMEAPATRAGVSHVTFSHETWTEINRKRDDEFPGLRIVGWYHSHPNIGVFLSKQDMFIQQNFFDDDGHVALVIDPVKRETVIYTWRDRYRKIDKKGVYPADGFWVSAPAERPEKARAFSSLRYTTPDSRRRKPGLFARLRRGNGGA